MKQILFIFISIAFLQAPVNSCLGNTPATYICESTAIQDKKEVKTDEEKTEANFYTFIRRDVIGSEDSPQSGSTLYYAGFPNANKAFNIILNFILPTTERLKFNKTKTYKSDLIIVEWKENTKKETVVENGFAQLDVTFTKRDKIKYTVVFCCKK